MPVGCSAKGYAHASVAIDVRALVQVIMFRDQPGKSRGFGFVTMRTAEDAKKAVEELNGTNLGGRTLSVSISEPREPRFPRALGGGDVGAQSA